MPHCSRSAAGSPPQCSEEVRVGSSSISGALYPDCACQRPNTTRERYLRETDFTGGAVPPSRRPRLPAAAGDGAAFGEKKKNSGESFSLAAQTVLLPRVVRDLCVIS